VLNVACPKYVDEQLLGTGKVTQAALIGLKNNDIWAISEGLKLSTDDLNAIDAAFTETVNENETQDKTQGKTQDKAQDKTKKELAVLEKGLLIGDVKYFCLQVLDDGRIPQIELKYQLSGVCLFKITQMIIVAFYGGGIYQQECSSAAYRVADYLKAQGY